MSDLFQLLASRARECPDGALLYRGGESISNRETHDAASATAAELRRDGVRVLAAVVSDPYELQRWIWATRAASCALALLPVVRDPEAVQELMDQVGAEGLVTDVESLADLARQTGTSRDDRSSFSSSSQPAFLLQTSGTTGDGKWVAVREDQMVTVIRAMEKAGNLRHAEDQVVFLTPPLSHSYGLSAFFEYVHAGSAVAFPQGTSPLGPAGELRRPELGERVTAIEGVSHFYAQLSRLLARVKLPALRHIGFGGGKIDQDAVARFRRAFPELTYSVRYGMTETPSIVSGMTFRPPYEEDGAGAGRVLPVWELRIVDEAGRPLDDGEEGEIELRGPCLAWPYYGEEEEAGDGGGGAFFPTGDLGVLSGDRLSIRGRKSLFIKHGGYRISPEDVEAVLRRFVAVSDARVFMGEEGLTAEVVGEDAGVVGEDAGVVGEDAGIVGEDAGIVGEDVEPSMQALREFAAARLPSYAVPKHWVLRTEIPRTVSGKIRRGPASDGSAQATQVTQEKTHKIKTATKP